MSTNSALNWRRGLANEPAVAAVSTGRAEPYRFLLADVMSGISRADETLAATAAIEIIFS